MTRARASTAAWAVLGGGLVAFAMPPWGWWPCAYLGLAIVYQLTAVTSPWARFRRGSLFALAWVMPAMLWMWGLTIPGYLAVTPIFAAGFGLLCAAVPNRSGRSIGFVGAVVIWEVTRWSVPFGGVPLATLAMSQADSPLAPTVRLLGPLLLVALTATAGVGLSNLWTVWRRRPTIVTKAGWLSLAVPIVIVLGVPVLASFAPSGHVVGSLDVALVQGGGEQGTRALNTSTEEVFRRHLEASTLVEGPVDLVVWPENAIDTNDRLEKTPKWEILTDLAAQLDAVLVVGVTEDISDSSFVNSSVAISPEGESLDRYEKKIRVPFGEFVPFRSLIEPLAPDYLPRRDAVEGQTDSVLETPIGTFGAVISWEVFFDTRGRAAALDGSQLLINQTNASSYCLTILQTQQVASSKLRALESGRYVLQVSPTGFTGIVTPDGEMLQRTAVSEQAVVHGTVELRDGMTLATRVGRWPMVVMALAMLAVPWVEARRRAAPPNATLPSIS